jgi:hypothetical protein
MPERKAKTTRALQLRTAADLLQKLDREIARLTGASKTTDVVDHATNAAIRRLC